MNDKLITLTDTRGRAAGTALQRAAMAHAWNAPAPKRPTVWLRPALVMAAVVAVIVGLLWVSGRSAEPADQRDPADLRYVIGDLPEGWTASEAHDESTSLRPNDFGLTVAAYGTPNDPMAPYAQVLWLEPPTNGSVSFPDLAGYSNLREVSAGSGVAACGDDRHVVHCALQIPDGPLQLGAVGLADTQLGQLLVAVQIVDGEPFIEPSKLPTGMTRLWHGNPFAQNPVVWSWQLGAGPSTVVYSIASRDTGGGLAIGWADENDMASAAMIGEFTRVDVGGNQGYIGTTPVPGLREVVWRDGDLTFALYSHDPSVDLVAMAESVRPASAAEWSAIAVDATATEPDATTPTEGTEVATPESTIQGAAPTETDPPITVDAAGEVRDVTVLQTVRPINEFDASYSCELPSGTYGSVQIAVVAGTVLAREPSGNGSFEWRVDGPVFTEATPYAIGGADGVIAISTDPAARQLRVTQANGDRYVLDLVPVQNHPEVRVGVIVLPTASFVTYDVIDADGNVLTSYESP